MVASSRLASRRQHSTVVVAGPEVFDQLSYIGAPLSGTLGAGSFPPLLSTPGLRFLADNAQIISFDSFVSSYKVLADGTLWSTGDNTMGQLGLGHTSTVYDWTQVGTDTNWKKVSSSGSAGSYSFVLALKADGTIWICGSTSYYKDNVNSGINTSTTVFVQIGSDTDWVDIAAGSSHCVGLKSDGSVYTWGYDSNGQCGRGAVGSGRQMAQISLDAKNICCGIGTTFVLKTNNTLYSCGAAREVGFGNAGANTLTLTQLDADVANVFIRPSNASLSTNGSSLFYIKLDGSVYASGGNAVGELGLGYTGSSPLSPVQVFPPESTWKNFATCESAAGTGATFGVKGDGTLWYCGKPPVNGSLTGQNILTFTQLGNSKKWKKVFTGSDIVFPVGDEQVLYVWGIFSGGTPGNGYSYSGYGNNLPQAAYYGSTFINEIDSIYETDTTFFIMKDGTAYGCGNNGFYQLGTGDPTSPIQTRIPIYTGDGTGVQTWKKLLTFGNAAASIGLKTDGTLWHTGQRANGLFGDGSTTPNNTVWTQIGSSTGWKDVWAGMTHAMATHEDDPINAPGIYTLYSWGSDGQGECARSDSIIYGTIRSLAPVQTSTGSILTNPIDVGLSASATNVIASDGTIWSCGVALGNVRNVRTGRLIQLDSTTWTRLKTACKGGATSLAAKSSDGTWWMHGFNGNGYLGLGDSTTRTVLTQLDTSTDWADITLVADQGNHYISLGRKTNGDLYSWGGGARNGRGTLSGADQMTPAIMPFIGNRGKCIKINSVGGRTCFALFGPVDTV